jgi:hypothetical protein
MIGIGLFGSAAAATMTMTTTKVAAVIESTIASMASHW